MLDTHILHVCMT